MKNALPWIVAVIALASILLGCGAITNLWWQSLGEVAQQAILAIGGVSVVYSCILPIAGIIFLSGMYAIMDWYNHR